MIQYVCFEIDQKSEVIMNMGYIVYVYIYTHYMGYIVYIYIHVILRYYYYYYFFLIIIIIII